MSTIRTEVPVAPRVTVDPWDPAYGVSAEVDELEPPSGEVELSIEVPAGRWAPVAAPAGAVARLLVVDGVRRVDAHVWIDDGDGSADGGICASFAAGALVCGATAELVECQIRRVLVSASPRSADLATTAGVFRAVAAPGAAPAQLALGLQHAMGGAEAAVAARAVGGTSCDLAVIDGPLRGRPSLERAVGLVKTHHVAYLPAEQHRLVARLRPGERTPLFVLGGAFSRYSWYLRLPGGSGAPWAGVVRLECMPDLSPASAVALAKLASAALPRFASEAVKDSRAPQNLYPIGALERELRHRLGDPLLVYRALRVAALAGPSAPDPS